MLKKSQITLFLLLGMVMLVVFGFLFYTSHTVTKTKMEKRSEKIVTDLLETTAFKYYVTTCLQDSTRKGLKIIGEQGGFFHKNQGSIVDWDVPYVTYDDGSEKYNVSYQVYSVTTPSGYGLKEPKNKIDVEAGNYPCYKKCSDVIDPAYCSDEFCYSGTREEESCQKRITDLLCGELYNHAHSSLLSEAFGSKRDVNGIELNLCKEKTWILRAGSEPYVCGSLCMYNPQNIPSCIYSVQSQLEAFIANETKKCVDFSLAGEYISELGYNISLGDVGANVSFGVDDVGVKINFPVIIRIKGYQPVISLLNFYATEPVRLYKIIDIAKELIKYDATDIEFRVRENSPRFKGNDIINKEGYEGIDVIVANRRDVSVVMINDSNSRLGGQNHYVFMFARENRPPALDYIADKYVVVGDVLEFSPMAYDPDEDELVYEYRPDGDYIADSLTNSDIYQNPGVDECINVWTGERNALRCSSYTTNAGDRGDYVIKVFVKDFEDEISRPFFRDYQDVNVFIRDFPDLDIEYENFYSDVINEIASIEDPYYIKVSNTNIPEEDREYRWIDSEGLISYGWGGVDEVELPTPLYDIENLAGYFPTQGVVHNIDISVRDKNFQSNINTGNIIIQVMECLPHRSSAAPFPFNEYAYDSYPDESDPFQADHTCCDDSFFRYGAGKECYRLEDYGCIDDFTNPGSNYYNLFSSLGLTISSVVPPLPGPADDSKDVYKRTLTRQCDGSRGNICDGNYVHKVEYVQTCSVGCCRHSSTYNDESDVCGPCS